MLDVVVGGQGHARQVVAGEAAQAPGRNAGPQLALPDAGARRDHGTGGDERLLADHRVVENRGADADQATVLQGAAVDDGGVADRDAGTDGGRRGEVDVHDAAVLDVAALADGGLVEIDANDGAEPDAAFGADLDVADDGGAGRHVDGGGDAGPHTFIGNNQTAHASVPHHI